MIDKLSFKATSDSLMLNNSSLTEYPVKSDSVTLYYLSDVISNKTDQVEPVIFTPVIQNSIVIGEGDLEGYFSEIPPLHQLSDEELLKSLYFPLSDSLKGTSLDRCKLDGVYGNIHNEAGQLIGSQSTSTSYKVSDRRLYSKGISTQGSYNTNCAVSSNVVNLAYYKDNSSWESCIGKNNSDDTKSFTDVYNHLDNNPYQAEDSFRLVKTDSSYQTVVYIPVTVKESGTYCVSLYAKCKDSNQTIYGPFLCSNQYMTSISVNSSNQSGTLDIASGNSYNKKHVLVNDWTRYHSSYNINVSEDAVFHIAVVIPSTGTYCFAGILLEKLPNQTTISAIEDVTDTYLPSAYSNKVVKYYKDSISLKYPLLLSLRNFSDVLQSKNWIISYKRRFDTTAAANDYHYDKIGNKLLVGYHGSHLYINTDNVSLEQSIPSIDGSLLTADDFYGKWEQVFIYPNKDSDTVFIEVMSLSNSKSYRVETSELTSDSSAITLFQYEENPLVINVMLGGKLQGTARYEDDPCIEFTSGYYRDFIYLYNVTNVESTLAMIKSSFLGLNKRTIMNNGTSEEKLLMFSSNIFEKGDNI